MKITVYELLGMIKDGKLPKMIKYHFQSEFEKFYVETLFELLRDADVTLYDEVEILDDEDEEKGLPEKLNYPHIEIESIADDEIRDYLYKVKDKFDEIIDYLEKQRKGE